MVQMTTSFLTGFRRQRLLPEDSQAAGTARRACVRHDQQLHYKRNHGKKGKLNLVKIAKIYRAARK
jgi:hypothetical protein